MLMQRRAGVTPSLTEVVSLKIQGQTANQEPPWLLLGPLEDPLAASSLFT